MKRTIKLTEEVWLTLTNLKYSTGAKSINEIIKDLLEKK